MCRAGQNYTYIYMFGTLGRETSIYTVLYGVYITVLANSGRVHECSLSVPVCAGCVNNYKCACA